MGKINYVYEPGYPVYKEHQQLEKKIAEGCTDAAVIIKKEKLYKKLLKGASHYLDDVSPYL